MRKILILFFLLNSCSLNNTGDYWNYNFSKEKLDFDKEYTFKEYKVLLEKYNAKKKFPNIN
ncbi:hypothetical protein OAJ75_01160 [Candidatus Pelagibacter sp.]|nr:hypothetical protein [Candidatus Pelagibacter sp.]